MRRLRQHRPCIDTAIEIECRRVIPGAAERARGNTKSDVVLLPDWRGQSLLARDHAASLVGRGCTVAIADLYGDGFAPDSPDQVGPLVQRLMEHRNEGVDALTACITQLRQGVYEDVPVLCLGYSAAGIIALDYGPSGWIAPESFSARRCSRLQQKG